MRIFAAATLIGINLQAKKMTNRAPRENELPPGRPHAEETRHAAFPAHR
jgi:hypothetical protein